MALDRGPSADVAADGAVGTDAPANDVAMVADGGDALDVLAPDAPAIQDAPDGASADGSDGAGGTDGSDDAGGTDGVADTGGTGDAGRPFTSVPPCPIPSSYFPGMSITFRMDSASYMPRCLKVQRGGTVTFMTIGGTFQDHPLRPSAKRGDRVNNPIMAVNTGTSATFTFPNPGYFAFFCGLHGFSDTGSGTMMDGVIWVE